MEKENNLHFIWKNKIIVLNYFQEGFYEKSFE